MWVDSGFGPVYSSLTIRLSEDPKSHHTEAAILSLVSSPATFLHFPQIFDCKSNSKFKESMASKLRLLQSKACQASKFVSKHGTAFYDELLKQNEKYIHKPATIEACNTLSKQLFHTRLASIPARSKALKEEIAHVKEMCKTWKDLKVEDVAVGTVFGLECYGWYCLGEIGGRGFTFTDYYV